MAPTIQQIIAAINPDLYYQPSDDKEEAKKELKEFKKLIKEDFQKAAEKAKPKALAEHNLVYDSSSETLEPVYFFILDLLNDFGLKPEKIVDNFSSSPGSGHFAELGQRATIMQQQGSKLLGDANTVLRSVLNILYDLKEFKIRLQNYDDLKSNEKREGAVLSLKQIWMDKVDIAKGQSSIKGMGLGQAGFNTLIDAFLASKDEKDVNKLDLNDRVKRIVLPRIQEFNLWLEQSERELKKRYEIEKTYLKSQVNSLKIYSRWAKPYLKAAQQLEMKETGKSPEMVKTFNTILLELTLLGKSKIKAESAALAGDLPAEFQKMKVKRDYYACILVDFKFRGIPQRVSQQSHYTFGGKAEVSFRAYALNNDELKKIDEELEESDIGDVLNLIKGSTESLDQLQDEINSFLEEKTEEEKEKSKEGSNPFLALIGYYEKSEKPQNKEKKQDKNKIIKPDDFIESQHLRPLAAKTAIDTAFTLFDIYKKAHGMPSYT